MLIPLDASLLNNPGSGFFVTTSLLDEQDNRRYGCRLIEAWPKTIGPQQLAYNDNNTYQTVEITIAYRYWINLTDESSEPRSIGSRIAERAVNTVTRIITSQIPSVIRRL